MWVISLWEQARFLKFLQVQGRFKLCRAGEDKKLQPMQDSNTGIPSLLHLKCEIFHMPNDLLVLFLPVIISSLLAVVDNICDIRLLQCCLK